MENSDVNLEDDNEIAAQSDRNGELRNLNICDIEMPIHGGDIACMEQRYGCVPAWRDFSANINPLGPPRGVMRALQQSVGDIRSLIEYPTRRERQLREVLAHHHRLTAEHIIIANGAAALIEAFIRTTSPRTCVIPQPAFSEYARALQAQGTQLISYPLDVSANFCLDEVGFCGFLHDTKPEACIVTNPHNPSGALIQPETMRAIIEECRRSRIILLVDEAFIDYYPTASVTEVCAEENWGDYCVILRSLTKFYAIPGLRVGYAISSRAFAARFAARIPSWPITAGAIDAAIAALTDTSYADTSRAVNDASKSALVAELQQLGLSVIPSAANFLMIGGLRDSRQCTDWLARCFHIAVRDCTSYGLVGDVSFIRVAVRSPKDNHSLLQGLKAYLAAGV